MAVDLRFGRWEDTLSGVGEVDAMITDPPYGETTHAGHRVDSLESKRGSIDYRPLGAGYEDEFCAAWAHRVRSWWVVFGDHSTCNRWRTAMESIGLYVFQPVPWVKRGAAPRFSGDGPASQVEYMAIGRPRERRFSGWGSLPGYYMSPIQQTAGIVGAKPVDLMRAIIRDYTRPGDLVADPHCGSGTTAVAARLEGRRCVTSEMDPGRYDIARKRVDAPYTPDMFSS